jgi:hypothetical protein
MTLSKHALHGISPVHLTLLNLQFSHALEIRCRPDGPELGLTPPGEPDDPSAWTPLGCGSPTMVIVDVGLGEGVSG